MFEFSVLPDQFLFMDDRCNDIVIHHFRSQGLTTGLQKSTETQVYYSYNDIKKQICFLNKSIIDFILFIESN